MSDKPRLLPKEQAISLLQVLEALYRNAPFKPLELTQHIADIYNHCKGNIFIEDNYSGTLTRLVEICIGGVQEFEKYKAETPDIVVGAMFGPDYKGIIEWHYLAEFLQETTYLKNAFFPLASIEELHPGMTFVQVPPTDCILVADIKRAYDLDQGQCEGLLQSIGGEWGNYSNWFSHFTFFGEATLADIKHAAKLCFEFAERNGKAEQLGATLIDELEKHEHLLGRLKRDGLQSKTGIKGIFRSYFIRTSFCIKKKAIMWLHENGYCLQQFNVNGLSQAYVDKIIREYEAQQAPAQQPAHEQASQPVTVHTALARILAHRQQLEGDNTLETKRYRPSNSKTDYPVKQLLEIGELALKGKSETAIAPHAKIKHNQMTNRQIGKRKNIFTCYMQLADEQNKLPQLDYKALMPKPKGEK